MQFTKQCVVCGGMFRASRYDARLCSATCRQRAHRADPAGRPPDPAAARRAEARKVTDILLADLRAEYEADREAEIADHEAEIAELTAAHATQLAERDARIRDMIRDTKAAEAAKAAKVVRAASHRPADTGEIRHFGRQIWPPSHGASYSYEEAWNTTQMHLWTDNMVEKLCKEPNPRSRANHFVNPYMKYLGNICPGAGKVLSLLLNAQELHPELTGPDDNCCPGRDMNIKGRARKKRAT